MKNDISLQNIWMSVHLYCLSWTSSFFSRSWFIFRYFWFLFPFYSLNSFCCSVIRIIKFVFFLVNHFHRLLFGWFELRIITVCFGTDLTKNHRVFWSLHLWIFPSFLKHLIGSGYLMQFNLLIFVSTSATYKRFFFSEHYNQLNECLGLCTCKSFKCTKLNLIRCLKIYTHSIHFQF